MTHSEPIAETPEERQKLGLCKCARCGEVGRCTPDNDYYGTDDGKLACENCVYNIGVTAVANVDRSCPVCKGNGRVPPETPGAKPRFVGEDGRVLCACVKLEMTGRQPGVRS